LSGCLSNVLYSLIAGLLSFFIIGIRKKIWFFIILYVVIRNFISHYYEMPFKSAAQRRSCYLKYYNDLKKGIRPSWRCPEWDRITKLLRKSKVKKTKKKRKRRL